MLFVFFIHKPLTIGILGEYFQKKLGYLQQIDSRKIVILAGSNGRFSHRCEVVEKILNIPCVNMSISANLSLDYQLYKIKPYLKSGDIVYIPLEYSLFSGTRESMSTGIELPYALAYDRSYIPHLGLVRTAYAIFYFNVKYFISSLGEMTLYKMGKKRRYGANTLTVQGDETGHDLSKALAYKAYRDTLIWETPSPESVNVNSYKSKIVADFELWAKTKHVMVVGGLPTIFDDQKISEELVAKLRDFHLRNGHHFLLLENRSQYSRDVFYDAEYHLAEEFQILHTKKIVKELKKILSSSG